LATASRPVDARRLAWEVLLAVEDGGFADALLARHLAATQMDPRDRAFTTRLVYGTLAWQGYLDHLIATLCRPPGQLDAPIRALLRLGLFQLSCLSRVPPFAAVDTAVTLSKRFRGGSASGVVNAVLRRYLRERDDLRLPRRSDDPTGFLSVVLSHPRWLVDRWIAALGPAETELLLAANNEPAPTVLRVNRLQAERSTVLDQLSAAGVTACRSSLAPDAIVVEQAGDPAALPGFARGRFSSQGEASQLVALMVGARRGARVLDACAAPGGKSTYLAELMQNEGEIVAVDRDPVGLSHLEQTARRLGLRGIRTVHADLTVFASAGARPFDAVLLDAPCSGLGTLRQHPEIKWRRTPEGIAAAGSLQRPLLGAVAALVRPGGAVVYATCTVTNEENEAVVEDFLRTHDDFAIESPQPHLPASVHPFVESPGFLRTFPHRHGLDGFFAVRLQRCR